MNLKNRGGDHSYSSAAIGYLVWKKNEYSGKTSTDAGKLIINGDVVYAIGDTEHDDGLGFGDSDNMTGSITVNEGGILIATGKASSIKTGSIVNNGMIFFGGGEKNGKEFTGTGVEAAYVYGGDLGDKGIDFSQNLPEEMTIYKAGYGIILYTPSTENSRAGVTFNNATIAENTTLILPDGLTADDITIEGTVKNSGTLVLPEAYNSADIQKLKLTGYGTVKVGENEYHMYPVDLGEEDGRVAVKITNSAGEEMIYADYSNKEVSLNVYSDSTIEILDEFTSLSDVKLIEGVENTTIKASSDLGEKSIKIAWKKSKGYKADYYQIFRSTKKKQRLWSEAFLHYEDRRIYVLHQHEIS